jgi:succinyl-diaminopimelate desuccinylase
VELVLDYLKGTEFDYEVVDISGVKNLLLWKGKPKFIMNAHYDVVPPGNGWETDPFTPVIKEDFLYGRGASDDKGPLAVLIEAFKHLNNVMLMVVGDEEKGGYRGTGALINRVEGKYALVAEPVSNQRFGDAIRKGRRGVLWLEIKIQGKGGHASRVKELLNPYHALQELINFTNYSFPKHPEMMETTVAITSVSPGIANNVVPSEISVRMDVRYNWATKPENLKKMLRDILSSWGYEVEVRELLNAEPFLNQDKAYENLVKKVLSKYGEVELNTKGGSSDARFFSKKGIPVLEIGPTPRNIHAPNEHVSLTELKQMVQAVVEIGKRLVF